MKALIVEDELLARMGLRSLIDWESLGIRLLEDAQNGREALEKLEQDKPDIMLLDLNVPEITGLELLKIIKNRCIPVKTIVVSCYDDFDTVKEAMKLGAVDYIRKFGLSREELTASLSNLIDMPVQPLEPCRISAAQNHYESWEKLNLIPKEFHAGYCVSFYLLCKYTECQMEMQIVETIAVQYYRSMGRKVMSLYYEGKLLLLMKEATGRQEAEHLLKQISPFVTNRCYIGITPYEKQDQGSRLFAQIANSIENYGFYGTEGQIIKLDSPIELQMGYPFEVAFYMERLEAGIQKVSEEELWELMNQLFGEILRYKSLSVTLVKKLMIEMVSRFSDKASQLGGAIEEIEVFDSYKHYQRIVHITNFDEMRSWWQEFIHQFAVQFFTRQKKSESDIIQSALEYIDENLDRSIQLSDVARHIGVSEPYLSSFFKRVMNENFIPYMNRQKMKRAKQLFTEGKLVYQVSELLGYENSTYFSKVFKKVEGVTPEQYRKTLQ